VLLGLVIVFLFIIVGVEVSGDGRLSLLDRIGVLADRSTRL
jgi:hypothetical protein